ncbi:ATP-dependent DNA helicase RecQ [Rhodoblastus acidophilus]|uniref:DNA helicase RecQ n=1 Tax=Rhodoblastus acidophilus TaxID=1074 RepID=UPI00222592D1|nr:DNA helicase RecQ [Rhodoblastus acidophilus]MCW2286281.1 ATP-dependent DNA helicase RecQ [Rhodoblastus acidophilus]MCW2335139.1 ATP-dependent DNA helicase RecQ [Rhodoblastus acidophilus]
MTDVSAARRALKKVFGFDDFRPGQGEIVEAVLSGAPVLAVMPTGSGKSLCYQLPALMSDGLTLVVSPLIALMRDQVGQMRSLGLPAATLNSQSSEEESSETWRQIRDGSLKLLFVSPERLAMDGLTEALSRAKISRVAVDEAHCICEWGHDFRPEYRLIRQSVEKLGAVQAIAFTATADAAMRAEIAERLFDRAPKIFLHSFDRPNISLAFAAKDQPRKQLLRFLNARRGQSGIVYCASRAGTERLAEFFGEQGFDTLAYHAGIEQGRRNANQDRFLRDDGVVAFATIAFGMGVNKPDVRFVAHADMPSSIESYYQEIGRAGRDGLPAAAYCLYGLDDMALRRRQIDEKDLSEERRRFEHERFSALASLCEAVACRRQLLLAHFNEKSEPCGACDFCRGEILTRDGTVEAQKALAAVYRTGQRFGLNYLSDLLIGTDSEALRRNRHDELKTFGVGADRSKTEWASTFRQLFAAGALRTASAEHGGFALTEKGDAILRGRENFVLRADPPREKSSSKSALRKGRDFEDVASGDGKVFEALRKLRRELANDQGIAAFMVFADRTLLEMAERRPATLDELRGIHGVGERKIALYGDAFLEAIAQASE